MAKCAIWDPPNTLLRGPYDYPENTCFGPQTGYSQYLDIRAG